MTPQSSPALARSLKVFAPRDLRLVEAPLGQLSSSQLRIRFGAGGICGSDMHYYAHAKNGDFSVVEPLTLGHEIAGTVLTCGEAVEGFSAGDHVAVNPARWCGHCPECRDGRINFCRNNFFMGSASRRPHMDGGFATVFDVEAGQCVVVPRDRALEEIAFAEPLSVCLHAASRAGDLAGQNVAVTGCGPIGLLTALVARHQGARGVTLIDIAEAPLALAEKLGFAAIRMTGAPEPELADQFDTVFEASGAPPALVNALTLVRRGGTIVQIGNFAVPTLTVPANIIMSKEIGWRGTFRFGAVFPHAVAMLVKREIDVAPLISARIPLDRADEAFTLAMDRSRSMKVILTNPEP